jgi:hypothetical protein
MAVQTVVLRTGEPDLRIDMVRHLSKKRPCHDFQKIKNFECFVSDCHAFRLCVAVFWGLGLTLPEFQKSAPTLMIFRNGV